MKKQDFYYDLPERLIAQTPLQKRDTSRLMCLDRQTGEVRHRIFSDIIEELRPGDCLVLNDSRVIPARIYGIKEKTGSAVEILLLTQKEQDAWEVLCRPGKKCREGTALTFGKGILAGEILTVYDNGNRLCRFSYDKAAFTSIYQVLEQVGEMPLPHYIKTHLEDAERYQTVYARERGSVAAPTAGLHFTKELLGRIQDKGVSVGYVTLHVGLGTFRPVKEDDITKHPMHSEHYEIPVETADLINRTKERGGRVICVGTTSCRTLEAAASLYGGIRPCSGWTDIFIYPSYAFRVMDGLITNFHLPESTLIMLVSAFAGREHVMDAYRTAIQQEYRFFSFGDAMFIQ